MAGKPIRFETIGLALRNMSATIDRFSFQSFLKASRSVCPHIWSATEKRQLFSGVIINLR